MRTEGQKNSYKLGLQPRKPIMSLKPDAVTPYLSGVEEVADVFRGITFHQQQIRLQAWGDAPSV